VVVTGGKWGVRRLRVDECLHTVKAEHVYDALVRAAKTIQPGERGTANATDASGRTWPVQFEIRRNAVWRLGGRVFLRCPACSRLCARLYRPLAQSDYRCRTCWGLTYASRAKYTYTPHGYDHVLGVVAVYQTEHRRAARRAACHARWIARRAYRTGG
jgi:hypothetical protein